MSHYAEEKVNAYSPDYQYAPSVSKLAGGGYVVVWTSRGQDGNSDGVYAQRFDASGVPVGPEFRVNTTVVSDQVLPQVAGLSDGSFAITWTDRSGADGSSYGVFLQRYVADGSSLGGEQRVNTYTTNQQDEPALAAYDGGFVVTWSSYGPDGSDLGVQAQRFSNAGTTVGGEFGVGNRLQGDAHG